MKTLISLVIASAMFTSLLATPLYEIQAIEISKEKTNQRTAVKLMVEKALKKAQIKQNQTNEVNSSAQKTSLTELFGAEKNFLKIDPATKLASPAAFNYYAVQNIVGDKTIYRSIGTQEDMTEIVKKLLNELPKKVMISSKYFDVNELEKMYYLSESFFKADSSPASHGLVVYKVEKKKDTLILTDVGNEHFNAATVKIAVDLFARDIGTKLKGASEKETILNVYDYMYKNFDYTAENGQVMRVGNMANEKMACNGFSYLVKSIFEAVGLKTQIREGYSHYWNIIKLSNGEKVTFDITSDIYLKKYKATLGKKTREHISISKEIDIFNADFGYNLYSDVNEVKF